MDRGIPTEAMLAEMRQSDPPVHYLVGTPKGRLTLRAQTLPVRRSISSSATIATTALERWA